MKRIIYLLISLTLALFLVGCGSSAEKKSEPKSMFVVVEDVTLKNFVVVYHRETKVMYVISDSGYNRGNFTLLVNPDGSPMLWDGETDG